jgi:glycine betaine/proline transport system ATP-binding protein
MAAAAPSEADREIPGAQRSSAPGRSDAVVTPRLQVRNLWKIYGADATRLRNVQDRHTDDPAAVAAALRAGGCVAAACDVSFDVRPGEIFVIMGLSGSGKSTVIRCLSRLVEPTAGEILVEGRNILTLSEAELLDLRRHRMGMVFQSFGLMPHMTVLENVAYPLRVQGIERAERHRRALETIELVGLAGRESSYPRELSGGMQQRVGIARSLAIKPDIWFLDEPFSALDPLIRRQMQDEFLRLQSLLKKSIVFITHDFLEALRLADRVAIMRDGFVVQVGTAADLVLRPANSYVADFTRDVPRARIITARDLLERVVQPLDPAEGVPEREPLEAILPLLSERRRPVPVLNDAGWVTGAVTLDGALAALVPPKAC